MTHYQFAFSVASALALAPMVAAADEAPKQKPNVILLVADDLGYGDMECYGAKNISTPNVNRLAAEGVRFSNCHATASTSTPSRYGLLTGEYAWRRSDTDVVPGNSRALIRPDQYTIADLFHDNGYVTAAIGKWHLGIGETTGAQDWNGTLTWTPRDIGFDYHYIQAATADRVPCVYLEQDTVANYDPTDPISVSYSTPFEGEPLGKDHPELLKLLPSHGHNQAIVDGISRIGYMKGGGKALWKDENIADSIADHSRSFILEHKDEPFFMYLCTNDPHVPRWPHERFRGQNVMGLRGDALASFDWTVGQILQALDDAGVADNTLIILTSDNGPVLDDGYQDRAVELVNGHSPSGPYRGFKYSGYEGGTIVPFIVRWPGVVEHSDELNNTLLSHIDLFGSFASLIGGEIPTGAAQDSGDTMEQFLAHSTESRPWVSELDNYRVLSIRTPKWKFIPANSKPQKIDWGCDVETGNRPYDQLFDIENEINEQTNVAEQHPELIEEMHRLWLHASGIDFEPPMLSTPGNDHWYHITIPNRDNRTLYAQGTSTFYAMGGDASTAYLASSHWKFVDRGDGTCDIINRKTGGYITPNATEEGRIKVMSAQPESGWVVDYANYGRLVIIRSADKSIQLNMRGSSYSYQFINWGSGTRSDAGCQFLLTEVENSPIPEIKYTVKAAIPETSTADAPKYYTIYTPNRDRLCANADANDGLVGISSKVIIPTFVWRFEDRGDGTVNIYNRESGQYVDVHLAEGSSKQIGLISEAPEAGWTLNQIGSGKTFTITCGDFQFNQSTSANAYRILNWGDGSNTTDAGCVFSFTDITAAVEEFDSVDEITLTGKPGDVWYDMMGRATRTPGHGIFISPSGRKVIR